MSLHSVYRLSASIAHVLKWRSNKPVSITDHVNNDAIALWTMRKEWLEKELLPSGSGFNAGTTFDAEASSTTKLVFHTKFHHMNDVGFYTRWTDHTVTVTPDFLHIYVMKVSGPNHNDIKDYIGSAFELALNRETDWPNHL